MNRRRFLALLGLGVAGVALEQAIPLGRVWSFPKEIVIPIGATITVRFPPRFRVGDYVTFPNFGGALMQVTAVTVEGLSVRTGPGWKLPHYFVGVSQQYLEPFTPEPRRIFRPSPS